MTGAARRGDWLSGSRGELGAERILAAAGELFARQGPATVGMNDIARAAGCSRATLYRYFENREALHAAYDESGEMLMHLQESVADLEVFARALTIGPETMVMKFQPDQPMHNRYAVAHDFLDAETGKEAITISQTVNAFFRWEFNSCEMLVKDGIVYPIDYANACPDVAVTSLHYYFPWAMKALLRWSAYCVVTDRKPRFQVDSDPWFAIADDKELDYKSKLAAYQSLADDYFETDRYLEFVDTSLGHVDELVLDWIDSEAFRRMLTSTIQQTYPPHEWDKFEDFTAYDNFTRAWSSGWSRPPPRTPRRAPSPRV